MYVNTYSYERSSSYKAIAHFPMHGRHLVLVYRCRREKVYDVETTIRAKGQGLMRTGTI
jgi:hypothetical protein